MKGMELSKAYFEEHGRRLLDKFPQHRGDMAAGLVGEGSECYGYDDDVSRDHDFGPGFCVWLPQRVFDVIGEAMQREYDALPKEYMGFVRKETPEGAGRVGIFSIECFYERYTGCRPVPADNREWFWIPERFLSIATNGEVFLDESGEFSKARKELLNFYPEDVWIKKLAARVAVMAQAGQYNYPRSTARGDFAAAYLSCGEFVSAALSAIYLLNKVYMPFYKWAFRKGEELLWLKRSMANLRELIGLPDNMQTAKTKEDLIEAICVEVAGELNGRGLTSVRDDFLQNHLGELMAGIQDQRLRGLHVFADNN